MSSNYGFEEYEGFVGNVDDFNGIIFCLREPHTADKNELPDEKKQPKEFWFQKIVNEKEKYYQELQEKEVNMNKRIVNKRIGTRFKNEFTGILKQCKLNESISDIAFCNVNPEGGDANAGKVYKERLDKAHEKIEKIIMLNPQNKLYIFTCIDIYEKLKETWKSKYEIVEKQEGVSYKNKQGQKDIVKKCFKCQIVNKEVTIFEIYHPSRRRYPLS